MSWGWCTFIMGCWGRVEVYFEWMEVCRQFVQVGGEKKGMRGDIFRKSSSWWSFFLGESGEIYSGWVGVSGHVLWIGEGGLGLVEVYLEG